MVLALVELAIPIWAERAAPGQQFHPGHIAERFGLFTIIVLGEVILSSTVAVREAIDAVGVEFDVLVVAAAALVIAFAVWWSYFGRDDEPEVDRLHGAFFWGYGHLPVFAGLAAFGAGVHVAVEAAAGSADVTDRVAALAVTVPLAVAIVGFTISVANARSAQERRLLPVEAAKFTVVLLLGTLRSRCTWRSSARRSCSSPARSSRGSSSADVSASRWHRDERRRRARSKPPCVHASAG